MNVSITSEVSEKNNSLIPAFLAGGGEMSKRIMAFDWGLTPVGPMEFWPQSLKTTLSIIIKSRFPMFLWWGSDLIQFYNDAYRPSFGDQGKHPAALGQKGEDCWPEIWPVIKPLIDQVMAGGAATWNEDQLIPIYRNGKIEDVYWTFSYSPVNDESGNVGGVLVVCNETTQKVNILNRFTQSDNRFRNLIREAIVGIIVLAGREMKVEIVNEMYGRLVGRTPDELMGKRLFDIIPEASDPFLPMLLSVMDTGETIYLYDQPYLVYAGGKKKEGYLNVVYQPYRETEGTITGVVALCHDVTEQVKARQRIEESELFAISIIKNSEAAQIVWVGQDMIFNIVNEKMLDILGRDNSIIGKPFMEAIPELRDTPLLERLRHVLATGETYYQPEEVFVIMRHGKPHTGYYNYSYKVLKNAQGDNYGIICTAAEVTEQVVSRHKIEQAEEKARLAIESAGQGTYEIDLQTDEITASSRFDEIWSAGERLSCKEYISLIHPDYKEVRLKAHEQSRATGNLHYEAKLVWKDGSAHWVKIKGKIIFDLNKNPVTLLGVVQDITEQKLFAEQLKEQVKERTMELQRSNNDLLQFAHVASHDLKEPVRKVKIFTNRLRSEFSDILPEKGKLYIDKVQHAAERMYAMIEGVLAYSTLSNADQQLEIVDLNKVINDIETDLEVYIQQKNAHIQKSRLHTIEGIPFLIHQLFYNLVNNALKFSKPGVAPVITISSSVMYGEGKKMAMVVVSDNGIGFEQEYADRIFTTFTRLNPKDMFEGTGLGLALCKKITDRHGGSITASGEKHIGASLTVLLPLKQN